MLSVLICVVMGSAVLFGLVTGRGEQVFAGMLDGAQGAVEAALGLMGSFGIFCGLMNILSASGCVEWMNRKLKKPLKMLLGNVKEEALVYVTGNLSANMLGLGNAATPLGLKAAKLLADGERATNALCMFLVINTSSVQLFPSTVVALRAAMGAANPGAVVLPGLLSTALSTLCGVLLCKGMEKKT